MPKIIVEGPDGKQYAFPDTMPREQINTFMRERYGTKASGETVDQYLARVVREQDATKARAQGVTERATAAGREARTEAATRMGIDSPLMMAVGGNALAMAERGAAGAVYDEEGTVLADEAAGLNAMNAAGFLLPGMLNKDFGARAAEGRRQQPLAAFAGDMAGAVGPGELISAGVMKAGQLIGPQVSKLGAMFKGKPPQRINASGTMPDEARLIESIRDPRMMTEGGDPVGNARMLDDWTPAADQQIKPMGYGDFRPRVAKRETRAEPFFDERLSPQQNKAVEMRRNGFTNAEIADELDTSEEVVTVALSKAKAKGVDFSSAVRDLVKNDVLALKQKGLTPAQIAERLQIDRTSVNVQLTRERRRLENAGEPLPDWLIPKKGRTVSFGQMAGDAADLAENAFGLAFLTGAGSAGIKELGSRMKEDR
jgi:DNA-binding CsgD family transcriptional regulator